MVFKAIPMKTSLFTSLQKLVLGAAPAFIMVVAVLSFSRCWEGLEPEPAPAPLSRIAGLAEQIPWEALGKGKLGFTHVLEWTDLYVLDIDSKTSFGVANIWGPVISPDGKNVAFQSQSTVGIYSLETGSVTTIPNDPPLTYRNADWTADSQGVIFMGFKPDHYIGGGTLFRQSIAGANKATILTLPDTVGFGSPVSASINNRLVLAISKVYISGSLWKSSVYSLNQDGSGLTLLVPATSVYSDNSPLATETQGASPIWSPDGSRIAYMKSTSKFADFYKTEIMVMDHDGGNTTVVTSFATGVVAFEPQAGRSLAWSPDGKKLAFIRFDGSGSGLKHIYVVNVDGSKETRVTSQGGDYRNLSWSR